MKKNRKIFSMLLVLALCVGLLSSTAFTFGADEEPVTFKVTYNINGANATGEVPVDGKTYIAGDTAIVLGGEGLTRPNYHFRGWRLGTTGGRYVVPGAPITITANTTLYAWWSLVTSSRTVVDWSAPRLDRVAFMTEIGQKTQIGLVNAESAEWSTNNPLVATVSASGQVVATGNGDATITATVGEKALTCVVTVGYKARNPMLPQSWQLYIPDGEPHVFDGVMYVYGSHDVTGGSCYSDYHVIYTEDGVHWTDAGYSFTSADLPVPFNTMTNSLWAPDCVYYPQTGKYYLFLCGTDTDAEYFVAESSSPKGPFTNARQITYKNGPLAGQRLGNIDPGVFVDTDGTLWLGIAGVDGQQRNYSTLYGSSHFRYGVFDVATATVDSNTMIDVQDIMTANGKTLPFEGPSIRKFGDYYYYIYVSDLVNPKPPTYRQDVQPAMLDYLYTKDIRDAGSWKYGGTILSTNDFPTAVNTHGSIERLGDSYYVVYHTPMTSAGQRRTRIERIEINPQTGIITPVLMTSSGVRPAFDMREHIPFSSVVDFSNGRWAASPFALQTIGGYSDMFLFMGTVGQYVGLRYVDFKAVGAASANINIRTTGAGAKLQLYSGKPGAEGTKMLAEFEAPNTEGVWQEVNVPIDEASRDTGVKTVYAMLAGAPSAGRVELDWLQFNPPSAFDMELLVQSKILEKCAATLKVKVNPVGFTPDLPIKVELKGSNGVIYGTANVVDGIALIRASAFPSAGIYTFTATSGDYSGTLNLDVVPYDLGMWDTIVSLAQDGKSTMITFGETPVAKNGTFDGRVTVKSVTIQTGTSIVGNSIIIPFDFENLKQGDKIVVSEVKYPGIFPSYSFKFTITVK